MMNTSYAFMAELLREWLSRARQEEISDALDLISQELRRRGVTLRVTLLRTATGQPLE